MTINNISSNKNKQIIVTEQDLPLACPQKNNNLLNLPTWDDHPIIYLDIKQQKSIICPYCQTEYVFAETTHKF